MKPFGKSWLGGNTILRRYPAAIHFRECPERDGKSENFLTVARTISLSSPGTRENNPLKLTERSGNVHENKGLLWKALERSWYVYENKCTYWFKAGMLLKIDDLHFARRRARSQWMEGRGSGALCATAPDQCVFRNDEFGVWLYHANCIEFMDMVSQQISRWQI